MRMHSNHASSLAEKSTSLLQHQTHLITAEHGDKVGQAQHEMVVYSPGIAALGIGVQQGWQEVCKSARASLLVGYAELI